MARFALSLILSLLWCSLGNASVYQTMGRARNLASQNRYTDAVRALDSVINSPHSRTSLLFKAYDSRARCHKKSGNYSAALADYDAALGIDASELNRAIVSLNKTDLLIQTGQYSEAEKILNDLPCHNQDTKNRRITNLASVYTRTERFQQAENLYKTAISEFSDSTDKAIICQNLGVLYMQQGKWAEASGQLSIADSLYGRLTAEKFISLSNLALSEAFSHNCELAIMHIDTALSGLARIVNLSHPDLIIMRRKKAEILLACGNTEKAKEEFREYFNLNRQNIISAFEGMSVQNRLDFWKKEKPLLSLAFGLENSYPELLFDVALFRRGISMPAKGAEFKSILNYNGRDIRNRLSKKDAAVDFVVYPKRDSSGKLESHMGAIVATKKNIRFVPLGLVSEIENHIVNGIRLKTAISCGRADHIDAVYSDSSLTQKIWMPVLGWLDNIDRLFFVPDGIFNLLAIEHLPGLPADIHIHRLTNLVNLLSEKRSSTPRDFLLAGGFDFDGLPDSAIENILPNHNAADFLRDNIREISFSTLPGMKAEVDTIFRFMPHAEHTYQLSEEYLKHNCGKYGGMHISTHGYTLHLDDDKGNYILSDSISADRSLLASGLALSGANNAHRHSDREDGLLSARELCDMDMRNIGFVVLSACQTADGKVSDEGPAGLVRGFKIAGAGTIIATLWEVNDEAAMRFMTMFYKLTALGKSKSEAFRLAQDYLRGYCIEEPEIIEEYDPAIQSSRTIETGNTVVSYPFASQSMWAPFILIDNTDI